MNEKAALIERRFKEETILKLKKNFSLQHLGRLKILVMTRDSHSSDAGIGVGPVHKYNAAHQPTTLTCPFLHILMPGSLICALHPCSFATKQ